MALDQETIEQQQKLLTAHRRTLAVLLQQYATHGAAFAPPAVPIQIADARKAIKDIKAYLHKNGVPVEDEPDDDVQPSVVAIPPQLSLQQQDGNATLAKVTKQFASQQRNRAAMLARVKKIWIIDGLERWLPNELRIRLNLKEQPDAVDQPMVELAQELRRPLRDLGADVPIINIFAQMDGSLLILGEPGAGKTTLLLELTRALIDCAERDKTERFPVPIVFPLSSWNEEQQPLKDWMAKELSRRYTVQFKEAQEWIDDKAIMPLLDGLDEVAASHQNACVKAINTYLQEHSQRPLVVSCRLRDYSALPSKLLLRGAILIEKLTKSQVEIYLERTGELSEGLRATLNTDALLWELMDTPLMIDIARRTYEGTREETHPIKQEVSETLEDRRKRLFNDYIKKMFTRRSASKRYMEQPTTQRLCWLANQLLRHGLTTFHIEKVQPDWLPQEQRRGYIRIVRLLQVVGIGLEIGLGIGLGIGLHQLGSHTELVFGTGSALALLLVLLCYGIKCQVDNGIETVLQRSLGFGVAGAMVGSLIGGLVGVALDMGVAGMVGLSIGLCTGMYYGGLVINQHYTLRWLLYRKGYLPLRLVPFLDYCVERIFLQKIGSSYMFIHGLLMEHFASLYTEQPVSADVDR